VRLASLRRSLFSSDSERSSFLNRLVAGCRDIMRNNKVGPLRGEGGGGGGGGGWGAGLFGGGV